MVIGRGQAVCPLLGGYPFFGVSTIRGSTVYNGDFLDVFDFWGTKQLHLVDCEISRYIAMLILSILATIPGKAGSY